MSIALTVYVAGLVATSAITYRNTVAGEGSLVLAAVAHLLWPLSLVVIVVWALASNLVDDWTD